MNKLFQVFAVVIFSGILMSASCNKAGCIEKVKADCICTMQYDPVCGCNGKTYGNACAATCASVQVEKQGECK